MVGDIFILTLRMICAVFGCLLILRAYMRFIRLPSKEVFNDFAVLATQWAVEPAGRFVRRSGNIEWPALFVAYLTALIYEIFNWLLSTGSAGLFHFIFGSFVLVLYWAVEIAMCAALLFFITSWVSPTSKFNRELGDLCYPFLAPIKKIIPTYRNIDFSALVFFIAAQIIQSLLLPFTR